FGTCSAWDCALLRCCIHCCGTVGKQYELAFIQSASRLIDWSACGKDAPFSSFHFASRRVPGGALAIGLVYCYGLSNIMDDRVGISACGIYWSIYESGSASQ